MHKTLYIIRHCKAAGQQPEAELSTEGIAQAELLANFLSESKIEYIVSSPFLRAIQSIEPLAHALGLRIETDERLIERILGDTSPNPWLSCLHDTFINFDLSFPGGESSRTAQMRVIAVLQDILSNKSQIIVLVSHGNLSTLLLNHFDKTIGFSTWKQMTNPDVFRIHLLANETTIEHIWELEP